VVCADSEIPAAHNKKPHSNREANLRITWDSSEI
jgi:hypothetical protein